ncbi:MAG: GNAT family N-acetyltransferase [Firmicutes bacterium]|nr:GNAT family N-acetyltransferase [Bacillota bacterium]
MKTLGNTELRTKRLITADHPLYREATELYKNSFPYHEQREAASQAEIMGNPDYHFDAVFDGETFIGEILYWDIGGFYYIEHFCIRPEMRNKRYGQRILSSYASNPLILEIDPPEDDISKRRREFYKRCGFVENPYSHVHPTYHRACEGHRLVVMSLPQKLDPAEYQRFNDYLKTVVMKNVF